VPQCPYDKLQELKRSVGYHEQPESGYPGDPEARAWAGSVGALIDYKDALEHALLRACTVYVVRLTDPLDGDPLYVFAAREDAEHFHGLRPESELSDEPVMDGKQALDLIRAAGNGTPPPGNRRAGSR
jgi:hypothetical protein